MEHSCIKCDTVFEYTETDIKWDYRGFGYDAKIVKCPCGCVNVIKYYEEPDREKWYYEYRR